MSMGGCHEHWPQWIATCSECASVTVPDGSVRLDVGLNTQVRIHDTGDGISFSIATPDVRPIPTADLTPPQAEEIARALMAAAGRMRRNRRQEDE